MRCSQTACKPGEASTNSNLDLGAGSLFSAAFISSRNLIIVPLSLGKELLISIFHQRKE